MSKGNCPHGLSVDVEREIEEALEFYWSQGGSTSEDDYKIISRECIRRTDAKWEARLKELEEGVRALDKLTEQLQKTHEDEISDLEAKMAIAIEALEYYSDPETWQYRHVDTETMKAPYNEDVGDLARTALSEIQAMRDKATNAEEM